MAKLTISKPARKVNKNISPNSKQSPEVSVFQIEVPGVGRLRTGERHPDFHIGNIDEVLKSEVSTESNQEKELNRKS